MSDRLTNSLLDTQVDDHRRSSSSYTSYNDENQPSAFRKFFTSRRGIVIITAISVIVVLAVIIPMLAFRSSDSHIPGPTPTPMSSSSSTAAPIPTPPPYNPPEPDSLYTHNLTIAGMPAVQHGNGSRVVLALPNVFGVSPDLTNVSISYAMAGYRTYAMDIFKGDPMPRSWEEAWWDRHLYNNTVADMQLVVDELRLDPTITSLQVVGFCYGGGTAAGMLAMPRPVHSAVSAHPTFLNHGLATLGNLSYAISPTSAVLFLIPDRDEFDDAAAEWIDAMWKRRIDANFNVYKGTGHGFAFDLPQGEGHVARQRAQSIRDTVHWLNSHDQMGV